jgi:hypothetical protein
MLLLKVRVENCYVSRNLVYWEKENDTLCAYVKRTKKKIFETDVIIDLEVGRLIIGLGGSASSSSCSYMEAEDDVEQQFPNLLWATSP